MKGKAAMMYTMHYDSPLGGILLAADEIGLTGYAGGIDKKVKLLAPERVCMNDFFVPAKGTAL